MKNTYSALLVSLFLLGVASPVQAAGPDAKTASQTTAPVYTSINTQTLEAIMKSEGYSVTADKDGDIIWKIEGLNAALMIDEKGDSLLFQISFSESKANLQHVNAWNQNKRYSRTYIADDDRVVLELDLSLNGGVSKARIIDFLKTSRLSLAAWTKEVVLAE
jgi:hypothetical protein